MISYVILKNERAVAKAREIIKRHGSKIDLDDIVFVGAEPDENTITTLPGTFPEGDFRYKVCTVTKREKAEGKRLIKITTAHSFPYRTAGVYFYGRSSDAVNSVLTASKRGILPFSYNNEHINQLNILFSLAFWTGCASYGYVQINPNEYNKTALDECLKELRYRENGVCDEVMYSIHNGAYYISFSGLSRTFGLLGLPYREGKKGTKIGMAIPWYVDFMYSRFGNQFEKRSKEMAENFRRIFMYSLLSNKTRGLGSRESVGVDTIATPSEEVGKKLTKEVAQQLMMTFPGLQIAEEDLLTSRHYRDRPKSAQRYTNRVHLYRENMQLIIKALRVGDDFKTEKPPQLEIRRLAANALRAYASLQ